MVSPYARRKARNNKVNTTLNTGFKSSPNLLHTTAIFGSNASGKSNFIKAIDFVRKFVTGSFSDQKEGELIKDVIPYKLSKDTIEAPSEFEIVFLHEERIYQYGFTLDQTRIYEEWLFVTNKNQERQKPQKWIERDIIDIEKSYINPLIKGAREQWKASTRSNALLFSTAVAFNSELLKAPYEWMRLFLRVVSESAGIADGYTTHLLLTDNKKNEILKFIQDFDLSIRDFSIYERVVSEQEIPGELMPALREQLMKTLAGKKIREVYSLHETEDGKSVRFAFSEESDGTRKLYSLAGPVLDVLEHGYTLIVDELNNSLHPHALRGLVSIFEDKKKNPKGAQLIFTSHDTNVMSFFERDNLWKLDRNAKGASSLCSIGSIEGRPDEAIEKRYLSGRYGGIPSIGEMIYS